MHYKIFSILLKRSSTKLNHDLCKFKEWLVFHFFQYCVVSNILLHWILLWGDTNAQQKVPNSKDNPCHFLIMIILQKKLNSLIIDFCKSTEYISYRYTYKDLHNANPYLICTFVWYIFNGFAKIDQLNSYASNVLMLALMLFKANIDP